MTCRRSIISPLIMTTFILVIPSLTYDRPAESTTALRSLGNKGVESSPVIPPICISEALSRICGENGIPPKLVRAIIRVESQGNPKAVSRNGALGLMQLMPEVIKAYQIADPFDPLDNIQAGVRHLQYLLLEFSGNLSLALAAYNAGPGTVRKYGGIPPYPETRRYVNSVLREFQSEGNELEMAAQILKVKREQSRMFMKRITL